MKRKIYLVSISLFLVLKTDVTAQKINDHKKPTALLEVIYECNTEVDPDREASAPESIKLIAAGAERLLRSSRSVLLLNHTHSVNYAEINGNTNDISSAIAKALIKADKEYFIDLTTKTVKIRQTTPGEISTFIKDDIILWEIHNDTVIVNGIKCIKASGTISTAGFNDAKITAWFTPDYPISMGPHGLYGLPGLILKYREGSSIITAKSIKDIRNLNKVIEIPTSGNLRKFSEILSKSNIGLPKN